MSEEALFHKALAQPAALRAAFLDQACVGRPQLRSAIESRLMAHEASMRASEDRPVEMGGTLDFTPVPPHSAQESLNVGTLGASADESATGGARASIESGAVIAGRYTLQHKLGEGGMGEVWIAKQTEPVKRTVAIKLIKVGMDSKAVLARFEQERQALALMDHPNIARVLDGGMTATGQPFFAMELVDGLPLTKFCDEAKLTPKERLQLFLQICHAVQHAHQKGIIHRDLKPANILVTTIDARPAPKVIDFGVAKATGGRLTDDSLATQFGSIVGTWEYMSPEQAGVSGADIDTRTDIYSLGVILYELLTGLRPIDGQRLQQAALTELIRIIQEDEPSKPSTRLSSDGSLPSAAAVRQTDPRKLTAMLRGELDWVVMKCLEKGRDRRYETANALARDIQRYLADEPVEARPPSAGYRFGKFMKRHKGSAAAASLVLAALIVGVIGTSIGMLRAVEAERLAEERYAETEIQRRLAADLAVKESEQRRSAEQAAAAEKQANLLAQKRLSQIEKASDILGSIFESLDPKEIAAAERPLQAILVEKLDQAAEQLKGDSIGDPLVVANMQNRFGKSLLGLGEANKAIVLLEKSYNTLLNTLGPERPETLSSMSHLAMAHLVAGKLDLALPLLEETLKLYKATFGPEHPDTLTNMNNLAMAYHDAGEVDLALPLLEETLKLRQATLGPEHMDSLGSMNNLATAYLGANKTNSAIPLLEETLRLLKATLGPEHPDTLTSMNNLAVAYRRVGKMDSALPLSEEALKLKKKTLGPEHPATLACMNNLATAYMGVNKTNSALPLLEESVKLRIAVSGPEHPDTFSSMNNLALAYQNTGKLDLALPLFEETLRLRKSTIGLEHPDTLVSMINLAAAYRAAGKQDLALPLYEELLAISSAQLGPKHPNTLKRMSNLASAYYAARQYERALPLYQESIELLKATLGPEHPDTLTSMNNLFQLYRDAGKPTEALALFEELMQIQKGEETPALAQSMAHMGSYLLAQKSYIEAERILRGCQAIREKAEPNAWGTFNSMSLLGGALLGQRKYAEAEPLLIAGYEGQKTHAAPDVAVGKTRLRQALERLVELYTAWDKPQQAADWKQKLNEL